jgi:GNAT superfamily N-acetyltransferase
MPTPVVADRASAADVEQLFDLQIALFREDAGVHDRNTDLTWPEREGRNDFERLLPDEGSLVMAARDGASVVGFLVGYLAPSSPTRRPVTYAVLRSLYVSPSHRGTDAARQLVDEFLAWARDRGCAEAHVDCYAANDHARRFYERQGFAPHSIQHVREL